MATECSEIFSGDEPCENGDCLPPAETQDSQLVGHQTWLPTYFTEVGPSKTMRRRFKDS
jgi:hypothetical protein